MSYPPSPSHPTSGHETADAVREARASHPAGRATVGLLAFTALFVLTQLYSAIPLLDPVGREFGGDVTFAVATSFSLSYAAGFLVWGPVSDQYGRKKLMVLGVLALSLATFACAFAPSVTWLAVLRGLQGLAAASFAPVALAYLTEAMPPRSRHVAIGAMSTAFLVAGIFGQVLASYVSLWFGWPWIFVVCGIILAGSCLAIAVTVAEPPRGPAHRHLGHRFAAVARVAARPSVLMLCCAHVTLLLSFVGMYTALGPHLGTFGLEPSTIVLLRLAALPGMFAALAVGPLAGRFGMAGVARAGFLLAAVGIAGEAALSQSLAGICVASLFFVTGVALAVPAMITLFGAAAAPNRAGGMALNGFVLFVGASIGPLAAAMTSNFAVLLCVFAALLATAALSVTAFHRFVSRKEFPA